MNLLIREKLGHTSYIGFERFRSRQIGFMVKVWFSFILSMTIGGQASSYNSIEDYQNGFQLYNGPPINQSIDIQQDLLQQQPSKQTTSSSGEKIKCPSGLLTFELSTGFIYKPASAETLAMMPSTLQLTDCLDYCLHNASCLAINFEIGLCVLLSSSAKQNPTSLYSSQFPVFTIYAEKKCLLSGDSEAAKQRRKCQRAWTFERVAGYEMKTRPRRRLKLTTKEHCMEACLVERDFDCRSANWYRQTGECTLSEQDRHSVSYSEAGDQQLKNSIHQLYGPSNLTGPVRSPAFRPSVPPGLYQNYYVPEQRDRPEVEPVTGELERVRESQRRQLAPARHQQQQQQQHHIHQQQIQLLQRQQDWSQFEEAPASAPVDYLENNCIYEPNKLCEFRKIQNRVLKTVDSIYQDVASLEECKQKCMTAPYRCYSFDYGDTSERVCRTTHLDQASLVSIKEPYLDVVGAITYELASCFNVSIQCRAKDMVVTVSSSKVFKGKIYAKTRANSCVNDVKESLRFELAMSYHDDSCDVRASSTSQQGVFSNHIIIQHHDRIVTTQDVGLSVYCQYDLGNRSITNNVDLAIERLDEPTIESKNQAGNDSLQSGSSSALTITSLATTVVRSPNVTMRITNMNGHPVASATVGDRLALMFEIKEKSTPFGIFVREIIAMDGKQLASQAAIQIPPRGYHYGSALNNGSRLPASDDAFESLFQADRANSVLLVDADGCPTDANIMGPLVKMEPSGHRVLAPFDAFKFPSSDMVFFRAVVSSCIAECKPVVCSSNPNYASSEPTSRTTSPPSSGPASSTRAVPPPVSESSRSSSTLAYTMQPLSSTIAHRGSSEVAPDSNPLGNSTVSPEKATSHTHLELVSADSLTTVPGFGPAQSSPDTSNWSASNVTNNHQGKAPPKPPVPSERPNSANLDDILSQEQKQQLVKLFESKLRQQMSSTNADNGSISEMAQLYTSYLASLVLNRVQPSSTKDETFPSTVPVQQLDGQEQETHGQDVVRLADFDNFIQYLQSEARLNQRNKLNSSASRHSAEQSRSKPPKGIQPVELEHPASSKSPIDYFEGNYLDHYNDLSSSTNLSTVSIKSERTEPGQSEPPTNAAQGANKTVATKLGTINKVRQEANEKHRKKISNLQALADSYLGAYQSFGKRRRRKRSPSSPVSERVYLAERDQPIFNEPEERIFTRALVEIYHINDTRRTKREAQPYYDLDEVKVQSIKILDKSIAQTKQPTLASRDSFSAPQRSWRSRKLEEQNILSGNNRSSGDGDIYEEQAVQTSSSAINLLMVVVSLSLLFVQIFLVAVCLIDRTRRLSCEDSQTGSRSSGWNDGDLHPSRLSHHNRTSIPDTIAQSDLISTSSPSVCSANSPCFGYFDSSPVYDPQIHLADAKKKIYGRQAFRSSLPSSMTRHELDVSMRRYKPELDDNGLAWMAYLLPNNTDNSHSNM